MFERKNILDRSIEGQTHFGIPRGAKMSMAFRLLFIQIHTLPLSMESNLLVLVCKVNIGKS